LHYVEINIIKTGDLMNTLYNLSVKNFGPINKAEMDITPLTIFVGKNGSGKSFFSLLIHSLSNPFNHNSHRFPSHSLNYLKENQGALFKDFEDKLNEYLELKPSFSDNAFEYSISHFIELLNEGFGKCYAKLIENELKNNWKTTLNNLDRGKTHKFEIKHNDIKFIHESEKIINNNIVEKLMDLIKTINFINPIGVKISTDNEHLKINLEYLLWEKMYGNEEDISLAEIIYLLIVSKLIEDFKINSFYIPAGGEIFNDFNRYLSAEISGINEIPPIQKEFLINLLNVNNGLQKGYFYDLACELEKEIINGEIKIKNGELKDEIIFIDRENNMEFDLNLLSSSVHELLPLIIYLKYYLNKGDTLIIEEIENHLHPENQLILVKYLVKSINKGLNIILTTHSDYILEEFNNLIRLGNSKKEALYQLGYDESCILDYEDVNIYNFKKNDDYSYTPQMIEVNYTGFDEDNFSKVIEELYAKSDIMDKYKIR